MPLTKQDYANMFKNLRAKKKECELALKANKMYGDD
jgi:uncharacterized protein YdaT